MILTIDAGNTNIVFGVYDGDRLLFVSRFSTGRNATADEMAVSLKTIFDIHGLAANCITGSIISSVVPQLTGALARCVELVTGIEPKIVGPGLKTGINIKIDNPGQLGSDLLVDSVAAVALFPKPVIVIDMGTATTISVVNRKNEFIGAAIMPGARISLDALSTRAAQLPGIAFKAPTNAIGRNTVDSMQSGIVFGNASMLDGMIERFEQELGEPCSVVATGGLAREICSHTKKHIEYDEYLMLEGLLLLYRRNFA